MWNNLIFEFSTLLVQIIGITISTIFPYVVTISTPTEFSVLNWIMPYDILDFTMEQQSERFGLGHEIFLLKVLSVILHYLLVNVPVQFDLYALNRFFFKFSEFNISWYLHPQLSKLNFSWDDLNGIFVDHCLDVTLLTSWI